MNIENVIISDIKQIKLDDGDVMHALKKNDNGYCNFGEVYFSKIIFKKIKAWKRHKKMTLNLIVPFGNVKFLLFDDIGKSKSFTIGEENYKRLTIPPGIWFGFEGKSKPYSLITSISDLIHDPLEVDRKPLSDLPFS